MFTAKQRQMLRDALNSPMRRGQLKNTGERVIKRTRYQVMENFLHALLEEEIIAPYVLSALNGKNVTLYCSADLDSASPYLIANGLFPEGYFCNSTALYFHNLTKQVPSTIYMCNETLSPMPKGKPKELSESTIRQEFLKGHRHTKYMFQVNGYDIVIVERRKGSGCGVERAPKNQQLLPHQSLVTSLERALIDAVVSPHYNGGITSVYSCFREAGQRIDANRLIQIYRDMRLVYPYSQTIGFFLDRLGMKGHANKIKNAFPPRQAFYVDRRAKASWIQDQTWRVLYPKGLVDEN